MLSKNERFVGACKCRGRFNNDEKIHKRIQSMQTNLQPIQFRREHDQIVDLALLAIGCETDGFAHKFRIIGIIHTRTRTLLLSTILTSIENDFGREVVISARAMIINHEHGENR